MLLDVFGNPAFGLAPLTDTINKLIYVPGRITTLGIFRESPITTTTAMIEERSGVLSLVSPTPRGGPGRTIARGDRKLRPIAVPHFQIDDAVLAEAVQGVRAFGTESDVETVQGLVTERLQEAGDDLSITQEYNRFQAIKGIITYADGSTLNTFDIFGITPNAIVYLDIDNADDGELSTAIGGIVRAMGRQLGGTPFTGAYAFCGDNFYNKIRSNPEVRATFLQTPEAALLREGPIDPAFNANGSFGRFQYGGIIWDNLYAEIDGAPFVDTDEAQIFPLGAPGLFRTYYAPADYIETVNTLGKAKYAKQITMDNDKGIRLESQTNCLDICLRPNVLFTADAGVHP
jgi:Phage major capsid protein E